MEEATIARDYTWPVKITTFDAGQDQRLTPAGQLRLQQEIGELHMSTGGLGYQVLCDAGMAFLLTRTNSVVHRAPALNEEVALRTWHRGTRGAQFYRCYEFLDKAGEKLIESVTAFALVDVRDHRLLRPDAFEPYGLLTQPERRNDCPDPVKWKQPGRYEARRRPRGALVGGGLERPFEQYHLCQLPLRLSPRRHERQTSHRLLHRLCQGGGGRGDPAYDGG